MNFQYLLFIVKSKFLILVFKEYIYRYKSHIPKAPRVQLKNLIVKVLCSGLSLTLCIAFKNVSDNEIKITNRL